MGGLLGWGGYSDAIDLLRNGYRVSGQELLAEVERLKLFEQAQMEIEAMRRKRQKQIEDAKKRGAVNADAEKVEGDLDDFFEDAVMPEDEE